MSGEPYYEVDDDPGRIDHDAVWTYLSTEAYWNRWRTRDDVERQLRDSWRVVGVYEMPSNELVGFARAFSDGVSDAYLGDVFILTSHQGRGLSKLLMKKMLDDESASALRWFLVTSDAHGLYSQFGFGPPDNRVMVRSPTRHN